MDDHKDEMIKLNVCGTIIETSRSTLTHVPDSFLARKFTAPWKESLMRDECGRVFLDEDGELIQIMIDFLRDKKKENPSNPLQPPSVRDDKRERFVLLLEYYGLTEFFRELPPAYWNNGNLTVLVSPIGATSVSQDEHRVQLTNVPPDDDDLNSFCCATFDAPLKADGEGSFWKITPHELVEDDYLHVGITGNATCYGWLQAMGKTYEVSEENDGRNEHLPLWSKGECRFFKFRNDKLIMLSTKTSEKFEMNIESGHDMHIYFGLYNRDNYKLSIEPVLEKIGILMFS